MSYKNHKDQKLLAEAYEQIQEAAPVGMGSRLGNWAKRKALSVVPFTKDIKSNLEGQKEYNDQVNKLKADLDRYLGKYNIQQITKGVLGKYLQLAGLYGKTTQELLQTVTQGSRFTSSLTDTQINGFIKSAVTEEGQPDNYSQQYQQYQQPQQQFQQQFQQRQQPQQHVYTPDRRLELMEPKMRQAWDQYYANNPQAIKAYKKKFPNS